MPDSAVLVILAVSTVVEVIGIMYVIVIWYLFPQSGQVRRLGNLHLQRKINSVIYKLEPRVLWMRGVPPFNRLFNVPGYPEFPVKPGGSAEKQESGNGFSGASG